MPSVPLSLSKELREHRDKKQLVIIHRSAIDQHPLHGFVVDYSGSLVLLQCIHELSLDGLRLIRRADISQIETPHDHELQREHLVEAGIMEKVKFSPGHRVESFRAFLRGLPQEDIVILEDEFAKPKSFVIGTIMAMDADSVYIRYISPTGSPVAQPKPIPVSRITSCHTSTDHVSFYQRHRDREQKKGSDDERIM